MKKTLAIFVIALGLLPVAASASLIRITGQSYVSGLYSSWEVVGHNANGDGYLRTFEVTEFSGITILGYEFTELFRFVFDLDENSLRVLKVADAHGHSLRLPSQIFHISVEDAPTGIPEPGALLLIGAGLIGLAFRRRRPAAVRAVPENA